MYAKSLITVAFAFFPFATASAQDVSHTAQVTFAAGQEAPTISIPAPAQYLGAPTQVKIELLVGVRGSAGIENLSKEPGQAMLFTTFGATVSAGKGAFQASAGGQFAQFRNLGAYDGTTNFAGKSGRTMLLREASDRETQTLAGKPMGRFLQNVHGKAIRFQVSGGSSSSLMGLVAAAQQINANLVVQVQVTYSYGTPFTGSPAGSSSIQAFVPAAPAKQAAKPVAQAASPASGNKK